MHEPFTLGSSDPKLIHWYFSGYGPGYPQQQQQPQQPSPGFAGQPPAAGAQSTAPGQYPAVRGAQPQGYEGYNQQQQQQQQQYPASTAPPGQVGWPTPATGASSQAPAAQASPAHGSQASYSQQPGFDNQVLNRQVICEAVNSY